MVNAVTTGPRFLVNQQPVSGVFNSSILSEVTALADGTFVATWRVTTNASTDIKYQRFDSLGNYLGNPLTANTYFVGHQTDPAIAALAGGGFVITWGSNSSPPQDGSNSGVYAQRFDSSGSKVGPELQVNSTTAGFQGFPSTAVLDNGQFVVVWESYDQDGSGAGIFGQRYNANGIKIGVEFSVNATTANDQTNASITALTGGGYVVTWQSYGHDNSISVGEGVYGRLFDANGNVASPDFLINSNTINDQTRPVITGLDGGGFVVTWESELQDGSSHGVYGQRYNAAGAAVGSEFLVNTYVTGAQKVPSIAGLSDGGFVIVWESDGQFGTGYGVYGQRYNALGIASGNEFQVLDSATGNDQLPSVAALAQGGFIVTWSSNTGSTIKVLGQMYSYASGEFTSGKDVVTLYGPGQTVDALGGNDTITGADYVDGVDIIYGGSGKDVIGGLAGDDQLYGGDNMDVLNGGDGKDFLDGGSGDDIIDGGAGSDTASYASAASGVLVNLNNQGVAQNTNGAGSDTLSNIENLLGSSFNDSLSGDASDNIIEGGDGDDNMRGNGGVDTVSYATASSGVTVSLSIQTGFTSQNTIGAGVDTLLGFENILGSAYNDTLNGDGNANDIDGGEGDDTLNGSSGNDTINGSFGDDTISGGSGIDVIDGGSGNDTIHGGSGNDTITGGTGNDVITGGTGDDALNGHTGFDTISYSTAFAGVTVNLHTGVAIGGGTDVIQNFDKIFGSAHNDVLTGNLSAGDFSQYASLIFAGAGDDVINGQVLTGDPFAFNYADFLVGEAGDDILNGGAGNDEIYGDDLFGLTSGNDQLFGGLHDDDLFGGLGNDLLDGGEGNDELYGGEGNDILEGGEGDDTIDGDDGNDTASYQLANAAVTVDLSLAGVAQDTFGAGVDMLFRTENLIGSDFDDTLTGDNDDNVIEGGLGDDTMDGGAGIDTVSYAAASGGVGIDISSTQQYNPSSTGRDYLYNFENITGSSFDDTLTGHGGANAILGGIGNDMITGAAGGDVLDGGVGIDTAIYTFSSVRVVINLNTNHASGGDAAGDVLTSIENIIGSAHLDILIGDDNANEFDGANGNDFLGGGGGIDTLHGGEGNDTINGDEGDDFLFGEIGADTLNGGDDDDTISGGEGDDTLNGGSGNDTLDGGAGFDTVNGGDGNDSIIGSNQADVIDGGVGNDTVDYSSATNTQKINLITNVNTGGFAHNDNLTSIENVIGSDTRGDDITGTSGVNVLSGMGADDRLRGHHDDDILYGGDGNDFLYGGNGGDDMFGGNGLDWAMYNGLTTGVTVSLFTGMGTGGQADGDSYTDIERVRGSLADDTITGDNGINKLLGDGGNDTINGMGGKDVIRGGDGDDIINGGAGNDGMRGDAGSDTFIFELGSGHDFVIDFEDGIDTLNIDDNLFAGTLSAMDLVDDHMIKENDNRFHFDFGNGDVLHVLTTTAMDLTDFYDDVVIV